MHEKLAALIHRLRRHREEGWEFIVSDDEKMDREQLLRSLDKIVMPVVDFLGHRKHSVNLDVDVREPLEQLMGVLESGHIVTSRELEYAREIVHFFEEHNREISATRGDRFSPGSAYGLSLEDWGNFKPNEREHFKKAFGTATAVVTALATQIERELHSPLK